MYIPPQISSSAHDKKLKLTPDTILHKKLRSKTLLIQSRDLGTIYKPAKNENLMPYFHFHLSVSFKVCQICWYSKTIAAKTSF